MMYKVNGLVEVVLKATPSWRKTYTTIKTLEHFKTWLQDKKHVSYEEATEELWDEFTCAEARKEYEV